MLPHQLPSHRLEYMLTCPYRVQQLSLDINLHFVLLPSQKRCSKYSIPNCRALALDGIGTSEITLVVRPERLAAVLDH